MTPDLGFMAAEARGLKQRLKRALGRPLQAGALGCLLVFYFISVTADFFAPVPFDLQERQKAFYPPQPLRWQWGPEGTGFFIHPLVRQGGIGSPVVEDESRKILDFI